MDDIELSLKLNWPDTLDDYGVFWTSDKFGKWRIGPQSAGSATRRPIDPHWRGALAEIKPHPSRAGRKKDCLSGGRQAA